MTPKDALYKQRQAEFRGLNKTKHKVPKGITPGEFNPTPALIFHKEIYHSAKTSESESLSGDNPS